LSWNRLKMERSILFRRIFQPTVGVFLDVLERILGGCR